MRLEQIQPGAILRSFHDAGADVNGGVEPIFFRVLKLGKVKVKVRCETGSEGWMYPAAFDKIMMPAQVDYVNWK